MSRDQVDDVIRLISVNEQEKNVFSCIWSMFSFTFRYLTTKTGEFVKEIVSKLPITKNRIEKLLLVRFLLLVLFRQIVEKLCVLFG